jgi:hypothetical protein
MHGSSPLPQLAGSTSSDSSSADDQNFVDVPDASDAVAISDNDDITKRHNAVRNPNFATGHLEPWKSCGTDRARISKNRPFLNDQYDAELSARDIDGKVHGSALCQDIIVPHKAYLQFRHREVKDAHEQHSFYWRVGLKDKSGKVVFQTGKPLKGGRWRVTVLGLKRYEGKYTLFFRIYGRHFIKKSKPDRLYLDNVIVNQVRATAAPLP